ncbi:MAG TPA: aspartyl protease family protein [Bryobacteraceae bacterium]|nr:aspartyl protease family protein [Bryobacteraceae bacterium]
MLQSCRILAICALVLPSFPLRAFQGPAPDLAAEAQREAYAGRNDYAATLFQKLVDQDPTRGDAYYGLVRALLKDHKSHEAYTAAAQGIQKAPQSSAAQAAAGLAAFRRGDVSQAEKFFQAAYKIDPKNPGALTGLASIYSMVSKFKSARQLMLEAYRYAPNDPALMLAKANSLKGAEHIAALEKILPIYDAESDQARGLRAHIANDRAIGDRIIRRLTSPYQAEKIKMLPLWDGPKHLRGMGLRVRFNEKETATLLLDTGASGISLSPKVAEKAGLELLGQESTEAKGIGDDRGQESREYLASSLQIGDVTFENYPVAIFRSAKSEDYAGLIGADVFARFLVGIDFVKSEMTLDPLAIPVSADDESEDAGKDIAPGFYRALRFGNHLSIFTSVNQGPGKLFLIDSGSTANLMDEAAAREEASVSGGSPVIVRGIQGKVEKTSMARHVSLVFAGLRHDNPDLIAFNFDKMNDSMGVGLAGVIGMPVLIQLKLTIDYRNGTVRMEYKQP